MGEKFSIFSQQPPGRGAVPTLRSPIRQRPRSPAVSGAKMENLQSTGTGEPHAGPQHCGEGGVRVLHGQGLAPAAQHQPEAGRNART